ncbi:MAG: phosphoribosylamine--glycine ligase [Rickettsiaceae bacterium H1]|nr:phosphoribosylamine--glycine ligase [Rickettsiaceae bacterium H1]
MNVLIVGGGGREHAILWAISKSPILGKLYVTGKIYGTGEVAKYIQLDCNNSLNVSLFCKQQQIDLVIIGPEKYLAMGLADALISEGILVFGPNKVAAQLESSKSFAKDICRMNNIPTAKYACFSDARSAKDYVRVRGLPIVIKADGLAGGKGVVICKTTEEADNTIDEMLRGKFGEAGLTIIIEEFLSGTEVSFFSLFDGNSIIPIGLARDYKSISYGDRSYNTGGMGSFSPSQLGIDSVIMRKIIYPMVSSLSSMGIQFKGVLFAGIMITENGPKLLEYNVRLGDPETQSIVVRLKSDLLSLILKTVKGMLHNESIEWNGKHSVCVVMASKGYPLKYITGSVIRGLEKLKYLKDVVVFHAGTKEEEGKILANGGRVLNMVASGDTLEDARRKAYAAVKLVDWPEGIYIENVGEQN